MTPVLNTCENCKFWLRKDLETGHCIQYAPAPVIHCEPERPAELMMNVLNSERYAFVDQLKL